MATGDVVEGEGRGASRNVSSCVEGGIGVESGYVFNDRR